MIHANRIVTVGEQECIIDRPIVLYRGDREVEIEFTLVGNEFMFSEEGNVIKSVNASHGQLVLNTPSGEHMFSELAECHEGKVVFVVTKEMIDEFVEMGFYSFQIRLYDSAEMKSRVTIPPVMNGFDIRNPIAAEDETNVVDQGIVDYARIFKDQSNEELPTFDWTGAYNKTEWVHHDVITENKMNKIEDALYSINANIKESDVVMLNTLDKVKKDADKYVKEHMAEVEQDVEEFERNLNTGVEQFKIDTNAAMTAHRNEVSEELESVNSQLAHIENNNNDIILYSFFENNEYPTKTNFFISVDGFNLNKINNKDLIEARDPSIIYKNGYWLVACTSYNPHDFKIFKSKDFVNWSSYEISCGLYGDNSNHIWAPEWFEDDNGDIYILISKKHGSVYDIDGTSIYDFRPYLIKCNNIDNLTFDNPISINLESSNKLDGHIIKHNNIYNLFIKDEYDKWIEHWTSNNLIEWVKVKDKVSEFGQYVEGTCIVKYNNRFYAYNDSFKDDNGYMYCCVSDDLNSWSDRKLLDSAGERLRHGSAYVLRSNNEKNILSKFIIFNMNNSSKIMRNTLINLGCYANDNNEIYDLELIDKAIYRINNNEEFTLKSVNNANEVSEFYLILGTDSVGSLTFDTDKSIIDLPNGFTYSAQYSDNDILIRFVYSETLKRFKPTTTSNSFLVDKYKLKKGGWKRQLISSTSTTIDELEVEDGVVYYVGSDVDVVINDVSSSVDGTHFYFMLNSGGTGSITINSGYNITVPNATYVISKNNNNNDCLIEFIKVNETTFRLRK